MRLEVWRPLDDLLRIQELLAVFALLNWLDGAHAERGAATVAPLRWVATFDWEDKPFEINLAERLRILFKGLLHCNWRD